MTAELKKLLPELNDNQHKLLNEYIEKIIGTSKTVYYVKGDTVVETADKFAETDRYCEIREELRNEQRAAAGLA